MALIWGKAALTGNKCRALLSPEELRGVKVLPHHGAWVTEATHDEVAGDQHEEFLNGVAATRATKMALVTVSSTLGYLSYIKNVLIIFLFNTISCHVTAHMKYYVII